jgi:hypothetical protein
MREHTYDDNVKIWKKAYQEVLAVCKQYPDFDSKYSFRDIRDMSSAAKGHLMLIDWYEKYGLKISHDYNPSEYNHFKVDDCMIFSHFQDGERDKEEGSGKYISWPDDDRQPKDEWLLGISFPTGAYIFGDDYDGQQQLFQDFIKELRSYNPDYSDSHNNCYYWKLENAKPIYSEFNNIFCQYRERNKSEFNKRKAEKLRAELAKLEESEK